MSGPTPSVSPELKVLMRRLRLGRLLDTLPERLALARSHDLTHAQFLEQLLSDEVQRRDTDSAGLRARAARLDPSMGGAISAGEADPHITEAPVYILLGQLAYRLGGLGEGLRR